MASVRRDLDKIVAHMKPVKARVKEVCTERAERVKAAVARHRVTGELERGTGVTVGRTDTTVYIEHEAVDAMEYGHFAPDGTWVEGIDVLFEAL